MKKKAKTKKSRPNTIAAYVNNVTDVDPLVDSVTVTYSGKSFHILLRAMMLAKAAANLGLVNELGELNDLQNEVAIECAETLQRAVDEMAKELDNESQVA